MKAIITEKPGDRNQLKIGERPQPAFGDDELLVGIRAAGVNRADILQRQGLYPPPKGGSPVLGLEMAGEIVSAGKNCENWKPGDRVFSLLSGGGYAQYAVIHQDMAMPIPGNLSFEEAAAIPEAFLTAYQAIVWLGQLQPDESILIHAGASGVGTAAIQIAREIGALIFITAGSDHKTNFCQELGADYAINYRKEPFSEIIRRDTSGQGVNLIIDFIGEPYWEANLDSISMDGRLVVLATMGGSRVPEFDMKQLMRKRATIIGSTLRNRSLNYKIKLTDHFSDFALPRLKDGSLNPVIDKIFPWEEVAEAHRFMEENRNTGKIILKIS
jgi:putative PIG3 family NAD(P)H quinone oxidoreductase